MRSKPALTIFSLLCLSLAGTALAQSQSGYDQRASAAVAYRLRYLRMQEERDIIRRTGTPRDLATGECVAIIPIDRRGRIRAPAAISCDNPGLVREVSQAIRLAAPYAATSDSAEVTIRVWAPVTQPGVNG